MSSTACCTYLGSSIQGLFIVMFLVTHDNKGIKTYFHCGGWLMKFSE